MKQHTGDEPICAAPALPVSPSMAYRLQLAERYKRVVMGANVRQGLIADAERAEILRVWMEYQNLELFKSLFKRADVAPGDLCSLTSDLLRRFLLASADIDRQFDVVCKVLKSLPSDCMERVQLEVDALHRKQLEVDALCDGLRYAQAAELELLRPLAWRP